MPEPTAIAYVRALDDKDEMVKDASLAKPNPFLKDGEVAEGPWLPYKVLVPPSLKDALRVIFKDAASEGVDCELKELGFRRGVLCLYGKAPKAKAADAPEPAPAPAPAPVTAPRPAAAAAVVTG